MTAALEPEPELYRATLPDRDLDLLLWIHPDKTMELAARNTSTPWLTWGSPAELKRVGR